jgi:hypothetical protein
LRQHCILGANRSTSTFRAASYGKLHSMTPDRFPGPGLLWPAGRISRNSRWIFSFDAALESYAFALDPDFSTVTWECWTYDSQGNSTGPNVFNSGARSVLTDRERGPVVVPKLQGHPRGPPTSKQDELSPVSSSIRNLRKDYR